MPSPNECPDTICHARKGQPAECFALGLNRGALYADEFIAWPAGDRCPMLDEDDHDAEADRYLDEFLSATADMDGQETGVPISGSSTEGGSDAAR